MRPAAHTAASRPLPHRVALNELSSPVIAGLLFTLTLALVALMAWKGGSERRDVTFLASAASVGGLCSAIAAAF